MSPQLFLQVRVHLRNVFDGNKVLGDIFLDTAGVGQPRWQERLDLPQTVGEGN